jgi:hypothetical protein
LLVLLAVLLAFGGYSIVTSSFLGWLSSPFPNIAIADSDSKSLDGSGLPATDGSVSGSPQSGGGHGGGGKGTSGLHKGWAPTGDVFGVIASYGSITGFFAALTALLSAVLKKRKVPAINPVPAQ